jgi:Xaa-Pro aminopeptidase
MDYVRRQRLLVASMRRNFISGLLVTHLANVRYLCGFTGSAAVLAVRLGHYPGGAKWAFFTDGRYREQAHEEVQGPRIVIAKRSALESATEWITEQGVNPVGIEAQHLTIEQRDIILRHRRGPRSRIKKTVGFVEKLRQIKEDGEIALVRGAVNLGASLLEVAVKAIRPGVKETDVAAELEYAARRRGADAMSFETIVAAGKRSALPHGRATTATIPVRGFVVLDFGVILHGYCSDMTRTVWVGKISRSERDWYEAVREAQQAATAAVRAGVTCGEVDHAARSVLRKAHLDRYFTHSTGHGVGLEIHETPRLERGQQEVLQPGMVVTIEPGVYIPGRGGVRIEDMVVVRDSGCEILTPAPKALMEL